jgi:hypothetical protein
LIDDRYGSGAWEHRSEQKVDFILRSRGGDCGFVDGRLFRAFGGFRSIDVVAKDLVEFVLLEDTTVGRQCNLWSRLRWGQWGRRGQPLLGRFTRRENGLLRLRDCLIQFLLGN